MFQRKKRVQKWARHADKGFHCNAWIRSLIKWSGDYMPHLDQIHLPASTKEGLFNQYKKFMESKDKVTVKYAYFVELFNEEAGDYVKIPKVKQFTRCTDCDDLDKEIAQAKTSIDREYFDLERDKHHAMHRAERLKYYWHINKSMDHPKRFISIISDGMDQAKTDVPHLRRLNHRTAELKPTGITVVGVKVHGHNPPNIVHVFPAMFPKDSSLTTQVLLDTLVMVYEQEKRLPPVLYLQMDNCNREGKNKTMMAFGALLVELGVFVKVRMYDMKYLKHTHSTSFRQLSRGILVDTFLLFV